MFGDLDPLEIDRILHNQILGRIGCHADHITYIVPISYAYDGEYIYAITREGMKINIMRQNPQVCFEVEQIPDMANWQSLYAGENLKNYQIQRKGIRHCKS